ncbi:MAG: enoyl-CoA hydratase/isomerase family protein [Acidobacteriota bacterium]|nr:enoyl-CoA hydratase/isomerase family protein [Acidobacteriota bacterium]
MSSYRKILYDAENGIARLTLNRPDKRNALDREMLDEIAQVLRSSSEDKSVRVVIVTGAGKDFCSGADLAALQTASQADVLDNMADARVMADLFLQMRHHRCPIVAVVRGRALAGGCGLATAADLIVASESAQFGYPEVNIGFVPAMVMGILRRSVAEKRAFELIAMGEAISSARAFEIGLINRVFTDETFSTDVEAYASKLAAKPSSAVHLSKNLLYHIDAMPFESAIQSGVQMNAIARTTADCQLGIARFLKKL